MPSKPSKPAKASAEIPVVTNGPEPLAEPLVPDPALAMLVDLIEMVEELAAGQVRILEELAAIRNRRKK